MCGNIFLIFILFIQIDSQILVNKNITDFLQTRIEKYANQLVTEMEAHWSKVCTDSNCQCNYHSCAEPLQVVCGERWSLSECQNCGSLINLDFSNLFVGNRFYTVDTDEPNSKEILCASQKLEKTFNNIIKNEEMILFLYFGSYTGILRNYPAQPACLTYDNRYRPWYVAATSGVKNLMLILDTSSNMSEEKLSTMKQVAEFILSTLTFNDYAGITLIGNQDKSFSPYLLRSDEAGITYMTNFINSLQINATSNYELSFKSAFDIIDRSEDSDRSSHCQQIFIIISGGETKEGLTDHQELLNLIDTLDLTTNSFYFTYSIGETEDLFLQNLACHRYGIYENINITDYYPSMLSYFQAVGSFITSSKITYSEPYYDVIGNTYMTTASIPVYDKSVDPPFVIGVFGFDITMTDLLKIGRIDEIYIAFQEIGSASCSKNNLTPCQVESLRPEKYKCGNNINNKINYNDNSCSPFIKSIRKCPDINLIEKSLCSYDFKEEMPFCCTKNVCSIVHKYALSIIFGFVGLFGLIFVFLRLFFKNIWDKICCEKCQIYKNSKTSLEIDQSSNVHIKSRNNQEEDKSSHISRRIMNNFIE